MVELKKQNSTLSDAEMSEWSHLQQIDVVVSIVQVGSEVWVRVSAD